MSPQILNLHALPAEVDKAKLAGSTVAVIDLLRASTTICRALASGATAVVPCLEVADALAAAENEGRSNVVLGGERGGRRIDGFDLGNSPAEYTPEAVGGRRVFLTTTNGTRALDHARQARRVLVGALVNLSALVESLRTEPRVDILCAGTDGHASREDLLVGGAIASHLAEEPARGWKRNDWAERYRQQWEAVVAEAGRQNRSIGEQLAIELRDTPGGRNLLGIGMVRDLETCAAIDSLAIVPELNVRDWRITLP
jgi:2-phosphosulfolactate phosphatase